MAISFFNKKPQIEDLTSVLDDYLTDDEVVLVKKAHKLAERLMKDNLDYLASPIYTIL